MKTRISPNSLESFATVDLSKRQKQVLECIKNNGSITAKGISYSLNLPINRITGRISELMHKQLITVRRTVKDTYNNSQRVNLYVIRNAADPINYFRRSWEERFNDLHDWIELNNPEILHKYNVLQNHEL